MTSPATTQDTDRPLTMGDTPDTSSWDLIEAARDGDRAAFGRLYDRYVDVVFRYVLFRVGDRPLAEDLTSETFTRALRRLDSYVERQSDPGAWFITIARNLILDHYKSRYYTNTTLLPDFASFSRMMPFRRTGPEMAPRVANQHAYAQLWALVGKLTEQQREVVCLRFVDGLTHEQVAQVTGSNVGSTKAMQHRAVRRLAELMPAELADCLRGD